MGGSWPEHRIAILDALKMLRSGYVRQQDEIEELKDEINQLKIQQAIQKTQIALFAAIPSAVISIIVAVSVTYLTRSN